MHMHQYSQEMRLIRDLKHQLRLIRQKLQTRGAWENQPRAPAGREDGGQWTSSDEGSVTDAYAGRLTLSSIGRAAFCEAQYQRDLNECPCERVLCPSDATQSSMRKGPTRSTPVLLR